MNFILLYIYRGSRPEVFLGKSVLKICSKFTGKHPCQSAISIRLQSNFIEITLWHGCSSVKHFFLRTPLECCVLLKHFFLRTPLEGCFCNYQGKRILVGNITPRSVYLIFFICLEEPCSSFCLIRKCIKP